MSFLTSATRSKMLFLIQRKYRDEYLTEYFQNGLSGDFQNKSAQKPPGIFDVGWGSGLKFNLRGLTTEIMLYLFIIPSKNLPDTFMMNMIIAVVAIRSMTCFSICKSQGTTYLIGSLRRLHGPVSFVNEW